MPALLGHPNLDPYSGYNPNINPNVDFMFNTVALRYSHTQVNDITWRLNEDRTAAAGGNISLKLSFFQPAILYNGGCTPIWIGLNAKAHNSPEPNIDPVLKDFLFAKAGEPGNDLISTNLRRGREVGLPNYANARLLYGLEPYDNFNFTEWLPQLIVAYNTTDPTNCDPWVCGIFEPGATPDGELGPLLYNIVKAQFERTRDSDRFWYLNNQFSPEELGEILNTTLTDIIMRNSNVLSLKCSVFEVPNNQNFGPICYAPGFTTGVTPTTGQVPATSGFLHNSPASTNAVSAILLVVLAFIAVL